MSIQQDLRGLSNAVERKTFVYPGAAIAGVALLNKFVSVGIPPVSRALSFVGAEYWGAALARKAIIPGALLEAYNCHIYGGDRYEAYREPVAIVMALFIGAFKAHLSFVTIEVACNLLSRLLAMLF